MGAIKQILEEHLPGVHVHSLMIGQSPNEDTLNGFFMSVDHQLQIACDLIKNDPLLQNGYLSKIHFVVYATFVHCIVSNYFRSECFFKILKPIF